MEKILGGGTKRVLGAMMSMVAKRDCIMWLWGFCLNYLRSMAPYRAPML